MLKFTKIINTEIQTTKIYKILNDESGVTHKFDLYSFGITHFISKAILSLLTNDFRNFCTGICSNI